MIYYQNNLKNYLVFFYIILILTISNNTACSENKKNSTLTVRPNSGAGFWYSKTSKDLMNSIKIYSASFKENKNNNLNISGIIAPHAGYKYSGKTTAAAYSYLNKKNYKNIIILGPSHHSSFIGVSILDVDFYETPLGKISCNKQIITELLKNKNIIKGGNYHLKEHSIENQLPFLQYYLGNSFKIIPILIGQLNEKAIDSISKSLIKITDENTLIIASSDFTHYGPNYNYIPFTTNIKNNLFQLNRTASNIIKSMNPDAFQQYLTQTKDTICGRFPILILLKVLNHFNNIECRATDYSTSGELTGDYTNSVSYLSFIFYEKKSNEDKYREGKMKLSPEQKKFLLKLARDTIELYVKEKQVIQLEPEKLDDVLKQNSGAFVTLNKNNNLRGCIGYILPVEPLYQTIIKNAINAAVNDYRFSPVTKSELNDLHIEISVLTQPEEIKDYHNIELGKHGIILRKGGRSSVFLPQVAPEQGWDLDTTLSHLSMKAGMNPDAYKDKCKFEIFEAIVFGEK